MFLCLTCAVMNFSFQPVALAKTGAYSMAACGKTKGVVQALTVELPLNKIKQKKKMGWRVRKKGCMHVWRSFSECSRRSLMALVEVD